eukprot:TRINITY_DN3114_c0_g2_i1.p1 TRINITY_DN3114_c0_g2~~TRINITY_DN3114_c0_g2_i1.p1  ORF type:complete len:105 (-),score=29.70 TRINITY_DN3114_c0_g2_i1:46-321(-)
MSHCDSESGCCKVGDNCDEMITNKRDLGEAPKQAAGGDGGAGAKASSCCSGGSCHPLKDALDSAPSQRPSDKADQTKFGDNPDQMVTNKLL